MSKSVIGALRVTLGLDSAQFVTGIKRSQKTMQQVSKGLGVVSRDVKTMERQFQSSAGNISKSMKGLAGSFAAYFSVKELKGMLDGFTRVQNALKVAGLEGQNLAQVQNQLLGLSSKYGVGLEGLAALFGNATQAGQELGASQNQIIKLTEATSQSLLITGTSAQAASGAILGLQQALASGTVRAEEFNQINEGGLRPLLQAAANSEKFGGSVAKLRMAVVDGKVSSQEFFNAILEGSAALGGQAAKATLTLSGAMEALNSRLLVYFGEADKANGVSATFAAAIGKLGDNLDTIIPALAVIGVAIGAKYAAQVGLATIATIGKATADVRAVQSATALAAAQARLGPFFTSNAVAANAATAAVTRFSVAMGVAGRAASALTPIAVTMTAIAMGFEVFNAVARDGEDLLLANAEAADELNISLDEASNKAAAAAREQRGLGASAKSSEPEIWSFKNSVDGLTESLWEQAKAARAARLEMLRNQLAETRKRQDEAYNATAAGRQTMKQEYRDAWKSGDLLAAGKTLWGMSISDFSDKLSGGKTGRAGMRNFRDASQIAGALQSQIDTAENTPIGKSDVPSGGSSSTGADGGKADKAAQRAAEAARRKAEREAERAANALRRFADDLARGGADLLSIQAELSGSIEQRRDAELNQIEVDRKIQERAINADDDLDAARKQQLVDLNNKHAGAQKDLTRQRAQEEIDERNLRIEQDRAQLAIEMLGYASDAARTAKERRDVELRILDAQFEAERQALLVAAASRDLAEATRARERLAALPQIQAAARDKVTRQTQGPLESYLDRLPRTADEAREALERVQVDGIDGLIDGLTDAATGVRSLGDVFKRISQQIIADLIRIQIQKAVVGGLSNVLGGLFGGSAISVSSGGIGGSITAALGHASSIASGLDTRNLEHFATGGSFKVGGAPGIDNNLIAFKATRGEMVDIRRPGNDNGGAAVMQFDLRGAVVTADLLAQMNRIGQTAAVGGALAGSQQAQASLTKRSRNRIP